MGLDDARFWNERDCEFRASWDSGMNQDRDRMHENWSGFSGIEQEDAVIAVSMGPVVDRTKEYLVAADQAVVYLRRRLLDSVHRVEGGGDRIGVSIADYTQLRAGRHRHRPDNALAGCDAKSSRRQTGRIIPGLRDHRLACQRHVRRPRGSLM